ncbi:MAG TPA: molybdopterin-synthase adenylyltransferase MoeB [Gemmatimonadaceae bacterium]|nr:molybdopterin-synthase adenylyltransferase MoeB [Gemmatimonadaceae bacterium]
MPREHTLPELTADETRRYSRHLLLPPVGPEGQRKLKAARVLLVGGGGLGSPAALYLAAAGIGTIGLVEFDAVSESNLQRQVLYGTADVGRPKLEAARERIADLNPLVQLEAHAARLSAQNALDIVRAYDVVLDGTDNFPTRYLVNDACVLTRRPYVYGSVFRFEGQASVFGAPDGPCYRCLFPEPPPPGAVPDCEEGGVLGVLPGLIGVIQATEVLKLVLGAGEALIGRLLLVDALRMQFRTLRLERDPECPACGTRTLQTLIDYEAFCGIRGGEDAVPEIAPHELAARFAAGERPLLLDVREPREWEMARVEGARLVPLGTLAGAIPSLDREAEIVVMCKSGVRSANAARQLRDAGFRRVLNLAGGIKRWSADVDPRVPTY